MLAFYLILNVAVGGTNGWFPDKVGNKPWVDGSFSESKFFQSCHLTKGSLMFKAAMRDFATSQDQWYPTWPTDPKDRGMTVYAAMIFLL